MRLKLVIKPGEGRLLRRHQIQVVEADTGALVEGVLSVDIHADVGGCTATVKLAKFEVEAELEASLLKGEGRA